MISFLFHIAPPNSPKNPISVLIFWPMVTKMWVEFTILRVEIESSTHSMVPWQGWIDKGGEVPCELMNWRNVFKSSLSPMKNLESFLSLFRGLKVSLVMLLPMPWQRLLLPLIQIYAVIILLCLLFWVPERWIWLLFLFKEKFDWLKEKPFLNKWPSQASMTSQGIECEFMHSSAHSSYNNVTKYNNFSNIIFYHKVDVNVVDCDKYNIILICWDIFFILN